VNLLSALVVQHLEDAHSDQSRFVTMVVHNMAPTHRCGPDPEDVLVELLLQGSYIARKSYHRNKEPLIEKVNVNNGE